VLYCYVLGRCLSDFYDSSASSPFLSQPPTPLETRMGSSDEITCDCDCEGGQWLSHSSTKSTVPTPGSLPITHISWTVSVCDHHEELIASSICLDPPSLGEHRREGTCSSEGQTHFLLQRWQRGVKLRRQEKGEGPQISTALHKISPTARSAVSSVCLTSHL